MDYHPSSSLAPGVTFRVVPHSHRGKPALVVLGTASDGMLYFEYQRQKVGDAAAARVTRQPAGAPSPTRLLLRHAPLAPELLRHTAYRRERLSGFGVG